MSIFRDIRGSRRARAAAAAESGSVSHRAPILRLNPSRRIDVVDEAEFHQPAQRPAPGSRPEPVPSPEVVAEPTPQIVEDTIVEDAPVAQPMALSDETPVEFIDHVEAEDDASPTSMQTSPIRRPAQRKKIKTRLLGFETDTENTMAAQATAERLRGAQYPVGWLVVVDGPGAGEWYTLAGGLAQIGRGEGQTVQLDFGDLAISRENHAAIAYDTGSHSFLLGCGQKTNAVRLNGTPVSGTLTVSDGDLIGIGETTLRLVALCDAKFHWDKAISRGD